MKKYICRKYRLWRWLEERGFHCKETLPDNKNPNMIVWIYDYTDKLRNCIEDYYHRPEFLNRE